MKKVQTKVFREKGITQIISTISINAPKERVWDALKNIGDLQKFHPMVKKSHLVSKVSSGLGAKRYCDLKPMGSMEEIATEWDEGNSFTMKVIGGKMLPPYNTMNGTVSLVNTDMGTLVTFSFSYKLKFGALGRLMDTIMIRPQFSKAPPKYVSGLKSYLEKD